MVKEKFHFFGIRAFLNHSLYIGEIIGKYEMINNNNKKPGSLQVVFEETKIE